MKLATRFVEGVGVVDVEGDVDMYSSPELRSVLSRLTDRREARVVVNLASVGFMDSSGIATLVQGFKEARAIGGDLRLASPAKSVLRVLELSSLMALFPVYDTVEEALAE